MILSLNGIISGKGTLPSTLLTNLYAVYKAESNANDSLGVYNGTVVGGITYGSGKSGNTFIGNGTTGYITLPNNSLNFASDFSVSMWINPTTLSGNRSIIGSYFYNGTTYGWRLDTNNANLVFNIFGSSQVTLSSSAISSGTWQHLVLIRKSSGYSKIYLNNSVIASNTSTINPNYSTTHYPSILATKYDASNVTYYNDAKLDELNVWNKELTATEITDLYNSGSGKFYPY